jgi:hypothetical protein
MKKFMVCLQILIEAAKDFETSSPNPTMSPTGLK